MNRTQPWHTFPLPERWSEPAVVDDHVDVGGLRFFRAGLSSNGPRGEEITGAAVELDGSPLQRGYFELLERISTREAIYGNERGFEWQSPSGESNGSVTLEALFPEASSPSSRRSSSNGVALHKDWSSARARAHWELAERDRVLRAWYGEIRPTPLSVAGIGALALLAQLQEHDLVAYAFPETTEGSFSRGIHVVGFFGFPRRDDIPLIWGYCARPSERDALLGAVHEGLQGLAFLWGEPIEDDVPPLTPTPMFHLERWQHRKHHALLRRWLDGEHLRYGRVEPPLPIGWTAPELAFVDLTPSWLQGGLRVAKAISSQALPLIFGESPFAAHLPPALRVHPIA